MARLDEIGHAPNQMHGTLAAGLDEGDLDQEVTFKRYSRVVLPLDGYVFWQPTVEDCFTGALHYSQEIEQREDETFGSALVQFTSKCQIVQFTESPIDSIYVACVGGFRFAFAQQTGFFDVAGLWRYIGRSIPPAMLSQLLDQPGVLDPTRAVASDSMPLWIALNTYKAPIPGQPSSGGLMLYPADLVPPNLQPPYVAVDIQHTRGLAAVPGKDKTGTHTQLAADSVRLTLYGLQNNEAQDFFDLILSYSLMTQNFGLMGTSIVDDGRRPMPELQAIAMQKFIDLDISYLQSRTNNVARQLITSAAVTVKIGTLIA